MLGWALTFFVLALVAAFLGFFALAGLAAEIAKLLLLAWTNTTNLIASCGNFSPTTRLME
jgi:uncharacterized membrane protein YtjA (UPF0391 family)